MKKDKKNIRQSKSIDKLNDGIRITQNVIAKDGVATSDLIKTLSIIITSLAFLLYIQSITFDYTLDDATVIGNNKITKQGLAGITTLLTTDRLYGCDEILRTPEYRPISLITFAIEWQFFGANPHVSHLINVLLFALTCLFLFLLLCKLFTDSNPVFPFVCCLLFVAHPIHTEVVNSIKSRDEILCLLFGILSIYYAVISINDGRFLTLILAAFYFLISLLSKETGIAFLIIIPLALFFFTKASLKNIAAATLALAVVAIMFFIARAYAIAPVKNNIYSGYLNNSLFAAPDFISQKATAFYILLRYILLLVFPYPLSFDYSFAQIETHSLSDFSALAGLIIYFAAGIYALLTFRKKSIVSFAILFYLLTLAPVSNIFFLIGATMAERFLYLPSIGFCILIAFVLSNFFKAQMEKGKSESFLMFLNQNKSVLMFALLIVALYSVGTFTRSKVWKDNATLFAHDVKVSINSARAHYSYGQVLLNDMYSKEQSPAEQKIILNNAIDELKKAIAIANKISGNSAPDYNLSLANAFKLNHDNKNALVNFEIAMQHLPQPKIDVYENIGAIFLEEKEYDKALAVYDTAIKRFPNATEVYFNKGTALLKSGKNNEAISVLQTAIKKNPSDAKSYCNLGCAYFNLNQLQEALSNFKKGAELDSSFADIYNFMAITYNALGDTVNAKINSEKAARLNQNRDVRSPGF